MSGRTEDRLAIIELMIGWMRRDLAQWDSLRQLFHEDGHIEVTWFEGKFSAFVDASMRMGASSLKTKHVITFPVLTFHGDRAIAETNAMIIGENIELEIGCTNHSRFYDRVEKRDGVWKIVNRKCIYDMGSFSFPSSIRDIDRDVVARYPREYAPLAYVLEKSGFPVNRIFATKGSELEKLIRVEGDAWLAAGYE